VLEEIGIPPLGREGPQLLCDTEDLMIFLTLHIL
jgi:hypothetical protein